MKIIVLLLAFFFSMAADASEQSILDNDSELLIELAWDKVDATQAEEDTAVKVLQRRFKNLNDSNIIVEYSKLSNSILVKLDKKEKYKRYKNILTVHHTVAVWETYPMENIYKVVCTERELKSTMVIDKINSLQDSSESRNIVHFTFVHPNIPDYNSIKKNSMIGYVLAADTAILNKRLQSPELKSKLLVNAKFYYRVSDNITKKTIKQF